MTKFDDPVEKRGKEKQEQAERELEKIIGIVREFSRLMGLVVYEPTTPELDAVIIGSDQ